MLLIDALRLASFGSEMHLFYNVLIKRVYCKLFVFCVRGSASVYDHDYRNLVQLIAESLGLASSPRTRLAVMYHVNVAYTYDSCPAAAAASMCI